MMVIAYFWMLSFIKKFWEKINDHCFYAKQFWLILTEFTIHYSLLTFNIL